MYASVNFKTKKELKAAIASGQEIRVTSPGPFPAPRDGKCSLEGPWYPEAHKWYAQALVVSGVITWVK